MKTTRFTLRRTLFGLGLCAALGQTAWAQQIQVLPAAEVLEGTPLQIRLQGFAPHAELHVRSQGLGRGALSSQQLPYAAEAVFRADDKGVVDLQRAAPLSGSYQGADVRGLFWSMRPQSARPEPASDAAAQGQVRLQVFDAEGKALASQTLTLRRSAADLTLRQPAEFSGAVLAVPAGKGKRPAVILLGGSEGGSGAARSYAPQLASQGFVVLGLPYYSPAVWGARGLEAPELPSLPGSFVDIELSRLDKARDWLAAQPEVDANRIAVYGVSKGAEFALAASARSAWIKAVVAVVPSDVVWEGWGPAAPAPGQRSSFALDGKPLPFVPYEGYAQEIAGFSTGADVRFRRPMAQGRAAHPAEVEAARIRVENFAGPMMLVAGTDDQMWDSAEMSRHIEAARTAKGLRTLSLIYEGAGHGLSGTGWQPTTMHNAGPMKLGGSPAVDAAAQADAWQRSVAFLKEALRSE